MPFIKCTRVSGNPLTAILLNTDHIYKILPMESGSEIVMSNPGEDSYVVYESFETLCNTLDVLYTRSV